MANKKLTIYSVIIASYTVISLLLGSLSFGVFQIRIAELLLVLCLYNKGFIMPVTIGCLLTNLIGIMNGTNPLILDFLIGPLATLLSALLVYMFREIRFHNMPILSLLFPVIINGIFVGLEIGFYFGINPFLAMIYVAAGEIVSVTILGLLLYKPIGKTIERYIDV